MEKKTDIPLGPTNMGSSANVYNIEQGNYIPPVIHAETNSDEPAKGFEYTTASIRRGFIRKVYSLLLLQLLLVFGVTVAFTFMNSKAKEMAIRNWWILVTALIGYIVFAIALTCCEGVRRTFPINLICLGIFTASTSVMVGYCTMLIDPQIVMLAIGATVVIVLSLTIFAFQTKWDFTMLGGILFAATGLLLMFGIALWFIRSHYLEMVYCIVGALIFCVYLIYDTQLIIGGEHKFQLSPEEYILGTLTLFLDIINIFLYILRILAALNK